VRARAAFAACALLATCAAPGERVDWPGPVAPVPSARQLAWQELEYYAFVHFNMNTFTEREWGLGKESPAQFAPSALDCRQWARVAKLAGMKGIILTAKHHDGFCLWPSKLTDHTVASSNWRDGRGDVLRELSDACHEYGLKFGVYLSPWDRHSPLYGQSDAYNDFFAGQLEEVLTQYGEVFEVWFDGACGEGPNGKLQVYNWERFVSVVRRCQPNAVIFSDVGPDVRWVGNENGFAGATCWSMLSPGGHTPGANAPPVRELNEGSQDGSHWIAAECDVSIRPGWYYRASEDDKVKTVKQLLEVYCASVGRNGSLLLNLPVDRRGLVHENDAARLLELRKTLDALFANDLARAGRASASNVRSGDEHFAAARATDGDARTYWATDDGVTTAHLTLEFEQPIVFDCAVLAEEIALGQRVQSFSLYARGAGERWSEFAHATTIGHKRILRFEPVQTSAVRLEVLASRACPTLASFELYRAPPDRAPPDRAPAPSRSR
jgi:alpha-L-fucosidase